MESNEIYYGHAYVDLGLPSGTLWATMNVGAESETDYGLYFAWGETQGYPGTDSGALNGGNYKYGTSESGLTKYNAADGLTTLEASDDAVTANWGGGWHMPDKAQIDELLDISNCTSEWIENYKESKVNGRLFTSVRNGKTLFVPATGACVGGLLLLAGVSGCFWSRSLNSGFPKVVWGIDFNGDIIERGFFFFRHVVLSVRGVLDGSAINTQSDHFDPKTLKPFDKVLVRSGDDNQWVCATFSHISDCGMAYCNFAIWRECVPYNDDTKHLVGTTGKAPEYYRYWVK